jgi:hypothetical protein
MANLTSVKIKDSYQSVLTTSETTSDPTTGTLQNGKGSAITALGVSGTVTATKLVPTGNVTAGTGMYLPTTNVLAFSTDGGERVRIDASGQVGIGLAPTSRNNTRLQIVDGIGFPATQVASTDPNTLDDYEEGTFDFGIAFGGSSTGVTYSNRQGKYTKIGNQVTVTGYILLTSKGAQVGNAFITGLPFTIPNVLANASTASLYFANITFANQFQGYGLINTTTIALEEITEAGALTTLTNADFANNSSIIISLTYFVS